MEDIKCHSMSNHPWTHPRSTTGVAAEALPWPSAVVGLVWWSWWWRCFLVSIHPAWEPRRRHPRHKIPQLDRLD